MRLGIFPDGNDKKPDRVSVVYSKTLSRLTNEEEKNGQNNGYTFRRKNIKENVVTTKVFPACRETPVMIPLMY